DTSLTAGLAAGGVAAVGATGAAVGLSGDRPYPELPAGDVEASVAVPDVPSVDVKKPKKGMFGGLFGSGKAKVELPSGDVDASVSVPDVLSVDVKKPKKGLFGGLFGSEAKIEVPDADVSVPDVSGEVSVPDASGSLKVPDVSGGVSMPSLDMDVPLGSAEVPSVDLAGKMPEMPSVEGGIGDELASGDVSVTAPDVKVEDGDTSLTAGLAAGGVAAVGAIGAAVGLSCDRPYAELPAGDVEASVAVPDVSSVDVKKPKKGMFGGPFGSGKAKVEVPSVDLTGKMPETPEMTSLEGGVGGELPSGVMSVTAP
ncbi:unnamed protein product, partial [Ectocarpus sp. 12 AP-2014]